MMNNHDPSDPKNDRFEPQNPEGPEEEAGGEEDTQNQSEMSAPDQSESREKAREAEGEPEAEEESGPEAAPRVSLEQIAAEAGEVARTLLSFFPKVKKPVVRWRLEAGSIWVEIEGDPSGRLIGRRGQTIDAFQHVLSKIVSHRFRKKLTVNVDAEKYKKRRREKLEKLAHMTADYVAKTGEARALEPMSAADRRLIHLALKHRGDVITASEGREPERFIVIWPNSEEE